MKLTLALLLVLTAVNAEAQSRSGSRGGMTSSQAASSSSSTSSHSGRLEQMPSGVMTRLPQGPMRRDRSGFAMNQPKITVLGGTLDIGYLEIGDVVMLSAQHQSQSRFGTFDGVDARRGYLKFTLLVNLEDNVTMTQLIPISEFFLQTEETFGQTYTIQKFLATQTVDNAVAEEFATQIKEDRVLDSTRERFGQISGIRLFFPRIVFNAN